MNRIDKCLASCQASGKSALIPYIAAGDPYPGLTVDLMHGLVSAGADIIELGIPFSDPIADGAVIQKALENALAHHTSIQDVLEMVQQFREDDAETPIVLMGYLNPIEKLGYGTFAARCALAGVDGVLTVDLPPEEAHDLSTSLADHSISTIYLMSPTTSDERVKLIAESASGYIYYVSLKGITGAGNLDIDSIATKMQFIKAVTHVPVAVGFGIKNAEVASAVAALADGVIVGSALVQLIHDQFALSGCEQGHLPKHPERVKGKILEAMQDFIVPMKQAMDQVAKTDS